MPGLFPLEDEDDALKGLLGMEALQAPALSDPSARAMATAPIAAQVPANTNASAPSIAQQRTPDLDAYEALAGVGGPPKADSTLDKAGIYLAMLADLAMNKGRSMGPLIAAGVKQPDDDLRNYELQMQDAQSRARIAHQLGQGKGDAETLAIRKAENEARMRQLALQERQAERDAANGGISPAELRRIQLAEQEAALRRGEREDDRAFRKQQAEDGLELRRQQLAQQAEIAAGVADTRADKHRSDQSRQFTTDSGKWLDLAGYLREADRLLAENPKDIPGAGWGDAWKVDADVPLVGVGKTGLDVQNALGNIRDLLARERSGAAFAGKEREDLYSLAAGLNSSDESKIRSAVSGMGAAAKRALMARRTGREGPADDVLRNAEVYEWLAPAASRETAPTPEPGDTLPVTGGTNTRIADTPAIPAQAQEPPAGKVLMQEPGPTGKVGYVPADKVEEAKRRGARVIQ